jgi:hypothetical protein
MRTWQKCLTGVLAAIFATALGLLALSASANVAAAWSNTSCGCGNDVLASGLQEASVVSENSYAAIDAQAAADVQTSAALQAASVAEAGGEAAISSTEQSALVTAAGATEETQTSLSSLVTATGAAETSLQTVAQQDVYAGGYVAASELESAESYEVQAVGYVQEAESLESMATFDMQSVEEVSSEAGFEAASSVYSELSTTEQYAAGCYEQAASEIQLSESAQLAIDTSGGIATVEQASLASQISVSSFNQAELLASTVTEIGGAFGASSTLVSQSEIAIQGETSLLAETTLSAASEFASTAFVQAATYTGQAVVALQTAAQVVATTTVQTSLVTAANFESSAVVDFQSAATAFGYAATAFEADEFATAFGYVGPACGAIVGAAQLNAEAFAALGGVVVV